MPFCSVYMSLRVAGSTKIDKILPHQDIIIYCCPLLKVMLVNYLILLLYPMLRKDMGI